MEVPLLSVDFPDNIITQILGFNYDIPKDFVDKLSACASSGMHRARDICDYCGMCPQEFVYCLLVCKDGVYKFKQEKSKLKLSLLKSLVLTSLDNDLPETRNAAINAGKFLLGSLFNESERNTITKKDKQEMKHKEKMDNKRTKISKDTLEFNKDSYLVSFLSKTDTATIEKTKELLKKHFKKSPQSD